MLFFLTMPFLSQAHQEAVFKIYETQQYFLENEQIFQLTKTADLPTGTYFMQAIMDNGDIISRKFIKLGA